MARKLFQFVILACMLLGLPLLGISLINTPITPYLSFPPETVHRPCAPFSWPVFAGYGFFVLAVIAPFLVQGLKRRAHIAKRLQPGFPFPWWGWFGVLLGAAAWIMAWNRFSWFDIFQPHTFTPLWVAYIITVSAMTYRRTGHCFLVESPVRFLLLFPLSAVFWWFFEFLNRFVHNWYYVGKQFGALEYFLFATLPFSTVLPAVTATREWLYSFSWPHRSFQHFFPIRWSHPNRLAWPILLIAGAGLTGIGIWTDLLFPLLWISPLLIFVTLQALTNDPHIFADLSRGDWRRLVCSALAALMCGFFWEMWNFYSLAQWKYSVPYVHRFPIFEMPILGYAGYIPFGLECAVISEWFLLPRMSSFDLEEDVVLV
ncbi:MAG: hypothetical protein JRJ85_09145 [Deltaproteobacteria bacterium]|nr:hypothetical protein [Deltaproteobacteria bacterium]